MTAGTFSVSRRIWSHPEFAPAPFSEREAFLWLVSEASWKDRTARSGRVVVSLRRGQLCASVRFMAEAWQWSKSRVDRFLKRLENRDMLRTESGTGQLVITLCNYDEYQGQRDTSGTIAGQSAGHERDSSGTNYKKDEIQSNKVYSEANASDAGVDFAKVLFDRGVLFLTRHGSRERDARAVIGRWRKTYQDTDIFDAFSACSKEGITDPIPWITAKLSGKGKADGKQSRGGARLSAFLAAAEVAPPMDFGESGNASQPLLAGRRS